MQVEPPKVQVETENTEYTCVPLQKVEKRYQKQVARSSISGAEGAEVTKNLGSNPEYARRDFELC